MNVNYFFIKSLIVIEHCFMLFNYRIKDFIHRRDTEEL